MKRFVSTLAFIALVLVGCNTEKAAPEVNALPVFKASIEQNLTKATMDGLHVNFKADDEVFIAGVAASNIYLAKSKTNYGYYTVQSDGTSSDLQYSNGAVMTLESIPGGKGKADTFLAVYPESIVNVDKKGDVWYELPFIQTYISDGVEELPMLAFSDSYSLDFKALCGLLKLNLKAKEAGVAVKSISVEADEYLCGEMYITVEEPFSLIFDDMDFDYDDSNKKVTLDCGTGVALDTDTATPFYITIPEGEYTNMKIKVVFTDDTQTSFTSNRPIDIELNGMYTISKNVGPSAPAVHETVTLSKYTEEQVPCDNEYLAGPGPNSCPDCAGMLNFANETREYAGWIIKSVTFRFKGAADSADAIVDFGYGVTTLNSTDDVSGGIENKNTIDVRSSNIIIPSSGDVWVGYMLHNISEDNGPLYYAGGGNPSSSALTVRENESKHTLRFSPGTTPIWNTVRAGGYYIWLIDLTLENPN